MRETSLLQRRILHFLRGSHAESLRAVSEWRVIELTEVEHMCVGEQMVTVPEC